MCDDNYGLNLDGIFVDNVRFVRSAIQGNDIEAMIAGILAWLKMAKDKELYDKSRDALGAFWRVVTLDYTIDENMNSQRIKNIDEHFAAALAC
jgi:hypothetical protein